ncbi:hypothetical protein KAW64_17065 [bacterium]|nr:hypothetical protein [bacterium]
MEILKYKGTGPAEVKLPWGEKVRRGKTIHVPDEIAEELVRDRPDDWEFDQAKVKVTAEKTAAKEEED